MSIWEQTYREYRRRQRDGTWEGDPPSVGKTDLQRKREEPFDDVYHAALCMLYSARNGSPRWTASAERDFVFRGQRKEWPVVPSLYRQALNEEGIRYEIARATSLARHIQQSRPELTDAQALAVTQHYSGEGAVSTWLIDATWDPFVALHFASLDGEAGDVGVVTSTKCSDWNDLDVSARRYIRPMRAIEVANLPRMAAQRALFIETSHPDMFEQCVGHAIRFRQRAGLVFHDSKIEPAVTSACLFPADDPMIGIVESGQEPSGEIAASDIALIDNVNAPLCVEDYLAIVQGWWRKNGWALDPEARSLLTAICEFHTRLQGMREGVDIRLRSLYRLRNAVEAIYLARTLGSAPTLEQALDWTLSSVSKADPQYLLLERALGEVHRTAFI